MANNLKMLQIAYDKKQKDKPRAIKDILGKLKEEGAPSLDGESPEAMETDLELMDSLSPSVPLKRRKKPLTPARV